MLRLLPALALALLVAVPASAQRCDRALALADADYLAGEFDAAIDRLTACLDAGAFSDAERRRAYRLVGLSYIGKDREAEARAAVAALLEVAPGYEPDPALDPPPFVRMVEDAKRRRPRPAGRAGDVSGVALGARGHGALYSDTDDDTLGGGGLDLALGYSVAPRLAVRALAAGSVVAGDAFDGRLLELGVGIRYAVGGGSAAPYLGALATVQSARYEAGGESVTYSGPGGTVEVGLVYALTPALALDAGLAATVASLGTAGRPDDITATTVRLGVGLAWRP